MSTLTLALSLDGDVVSALTAPKELKYTCLECGAPLHVKRGEQRAAHFAHTSDSHTGCTGESVTHLAAKRLLRNQLHAELTRARLVQWSLLCPGPRHEHRTAAGQDTWCRMRSLIPQCHEVPGDWEVREEVTHGRYRFDVAVVMAGRVVFGFEVYHRHLVPDEKAADLNVPWLELAAEDILEFKPRVPFQGSHSRQHCPECQAILKQWQEEQARRTQRAQATQQFEVEVTRVKTTWQGILRAARTVGEEQRVTHGS
ncbi:hypothetical protein [Deinococcus aquaticus]|uniref:competence protein CoiA family protein n=1 Tax=Deinococcus aquaticus TaxID=328692 RepID=UPI003F489B39